MVEQVGAPARVGLVAPVDVIVPPGSTGLDPSQTSFFQVCTLNFVLYKLSYAFPSSYVAFYVCVNECIYVDQVLNIPTKINKGTVEIITPVEIIKKGEKVGSSESALLSKLGIKPFSYGLIVEHVYDDGSVFDPKILELTEDDLAEKFAAGLANVISISMALAYPTLAAVPHMFTNAYKNLLSLAIATEYSFPLADKIKEYLEDPTKFASAAPVAAATPAAAGSSAAAPAKEEKKEESEESDEDGFVAGLFDD